MKRVPAIVFLLMSVAVVSLSEAQPGPTARTPGSSPFSSLAARAGPARIDPGVRTFRPMPGPARPHPVRVAPFGNLHFVTSSPTNGFVGQGYFPGTPCLTNPSYSGSMYCRQFFPRGRERSREIFLPYIIYPFPEYDSAQESPAALPPEEDPVVSQIANLTEEVRQLKETEEDQSVRREVPAPPAAIVEGPVEKSVPTVLVYRDGHKIEIKDYALRGETLWIFLGQSARKIPLADLNLVQTKKVNEDRGVDFFPDGSL